MKIKDKDPAAALFKSREMELTATFDTKTYSYMGLRMDGRAFHTFTKAFEKPYDTSLMASMNEACMYVLKSIAPNAICAYVQSDEITVIMPTYSSKTGEDLNFFGNKIQKVTSLSAAATTAGFAKGLLENSHFMNVYGGETKALPIFDSRVFGLKNLDEVFEYITWRRLDARKNAITMAASALFSDRELHGKSTCQRIEMLQGTIYERLPEDFMNGRFFMPTEVEKTIEVFGKEQTVASKVWTAVAAERSLVEEFFLKLKNESGSAE